MNARIHTDGALFLEMTPGGDGHLVGSAAGDLHHHEGIADETRVEDGFDQTIRWVPTVIFGRGEDRSTVRCGVNQRPTGPDGNAQRFFDQSVLSAGEGGNSDLVMGRSIGHDVDGEDVGIRDDQIEVGRQLVPNTAKGLAGTSLERVSTWRMTYLSSNCQSESAPAHFVSSTVDDKRPGSVHLPAGEDTLKLASAADTNRPRKRQS